ncbi:EboA domain-containing protein [Cytophagaceae bacterium ABcell3]|nr:EboA domain-containing protein [Cytophagaceae bacterium ABcell3]
MRLSTVIYHLLSEHLSDDASEWLNAKMALLEKGKEKDLFFSFSSAPRMVGKKTLTISAEQTKVLKMLGTGIEWQHLTVDTISRWLMLVSYPSHDESHYHAVLSKLFSTADMEEQIALYKALPLLPHPHKFRFQATEGIRSNIKGVFEAVALDNPFPQQQMDESAWNQLVLKAFFIGSPLYRIKGLDERANSALARMLVDFAHERWAAGRSVNPELWRLVGPFLDLKVFEDLYKLYHSHNSDDRIAAALACAQSTLPEARQLLEKDMKLCDAIERGKLNWDIFSRQLYAEEFEELQP